jgi:glutathione S-transferase
MYRQPVELTGHVCCRRSIPMLEFPDGTCYTQSNAVYNLVARRTGLYPIDDIEQAFIVDNIVAHVSDAKNLPYSALSGALTKQVSQTDQSRSAASIHVAHLELLHTPHCSCCALCCDRLLHRG